MPSTRTQDAAWPHARFVRLGPRLQVREGLHSLEGAADRRLATDVRTGQAQNVAQVMHEQQARLDLRPMIDTIDVDTDSLLHERYLFTDYSVLKGKLCGKFSMPVSDESQ